MISISNRPRHKVSSGHGLATGTDASVQLQTAIIAIPHGAQQ